MKKTILTLGLISALFSNCKEPNHKPSISEERETIEGLDEHDINNEQHTFENSWVNEITLDNGSKWSANTETTEGVAKMIELIKTNETTSVEDFHLLAKKLNEVKNVVVRECTMKGAPHDNLHIFLHPLIEKIEILSKVSTIADGNKVLASIKINLEQYYNYFK